MNQFVTSPFEYLVMFIILNTHVLPLLSFVTGLYVHVAVPDRGRILLSCFGQR